MPHAQGKVLLAMSGGVDSSVAAALLLQQGYEVVGCFMRLGSPGEELEPTCDLRPESCDPISHPASRTPQAALRIAHQGCCSINDAKDAQLVAAQLGIPLYVLNFKRDFGRIIRYFADEYHAGRTPNPCVRCNNWLKFGKLVDYARSIDADFVASGHYARIAASPSGGGGRSRLRDPQLLRGIDDSKDQSYVLFGIPRDQLAHTLLPVGQYRKSEIRQLALDLHLPVHNKPDSQEICFVPSNNYLDVIAPQRAGASPPPQRAGASPPPQRAGASPPPVPPAASNTVRPGPLLSTTGQSLGQHPGHQHFTIGQRRGLGVATGQPLYVIDKNAAANTVTVGPRDALFSTGLVASETNWLVDPPVAPVECQVKIRYNADPVPAVAQLTGDQLRVTFAQPQLAVAPGQAVVCYDEARVLGGGWIDRPLRGNGQ
ncbi:MAG: tRNA 2-thiouridine(34) synthase MnmA [Phycisphaerales bacterium]